MPSNHFSALIIRILFIFACIMALDYGLFTYATSRQPADLRLIAAQDIRFAESMIQAGPDGNLASEPDIAKWTPYPADGQLNKKKFVLNYQLPDTLPPDAILNILNDSDYIAIYVGTDKRLEYGKPDARRWTYSQERHQIGLTPQDAGKHVYIDMYYHTGNANPFTFYIARRADTIENLFFASLFRVVLPLSILLFIGIAGLLMWLGRPKEFAALWVSLMAFAVLPYCLTQNFSSIRYVLWNDQSWVTYFGRVGIQVFVAVFLAYLREILPARHSRMLKLIIRGILAIALIDALLLVSSDPWADRLELVTNWLDMGLCLYYGTVLLVLHRRTTMLSMRTTLAGFLLFLLFALKELITVFVPESGDMGSLFVHSSQIVWGTLVLILAFAWGAVLRVQEAREKYTRELELAHTALNRTNKAYERFVPKQFLEHLNRENIIDVQLGDQVRKRMAVLFSDIRSFTTMSESMTPEETFQFLNRYLGLMELIIAKHGGFIDKYMGDGIMALFDKGVDDALRASIMMLKALREYNDERAGQGLAPIQIGIGIHTGDLMLGTLGGEGRMEGTVISDVVNTASRLEGLTKTLAAPLLISEETLLALHHPETFATRAIDVAQVKGRKERISVYEVMDAEPASSLRQKQDVAPLLQRGRQFMEESNYDAALQIWMQCQELAPEDPVILMWLSRCRAVMGGSNAIN